MPLLKQRKSIWNKIISIRLGSVVGQKFHYVYVIKEWPKNGWVAEWLFYVLHTVVKNDKGHLLFFLNVDFHVLIDPEVDGVFDKRWSPPRQSTDTKRQTGERQCRQDVRTILQKVFQILRVVVSQCKFGTCS